jgi:UDP-N-acetyl-D-mannosaminuronate dehydrogenase
LFGLSYKKDLSDLRESPSLIIKKLLEKYEAIIDVYEPFNLDISDSKTLEEALDKNEVILVATNHTIFEKSLNKQILEKNNITILVDGKNCLDKYEYTDSKVVYV